LQVELARRVDFRIKSYPQSKRIVFLKWLYDIIHLLL
jgi:hypothetical protein